MQSRLLRGFPGLMLALVGQGARARPAMAPPCIRRVEAPPPGRHTRGRGTLLVIVPGGRAGRQHSARFSGRAGRQHSARFSAWSPRPAQPTSLPGMARSWCHGTGRRRSWPPRGSVEQLPTIRATCAADDAGAARGGAGPLGMPSRRHEARFGQARAARRVPGGDGRRALPSIPRGGTAAAVARAAAPHRHGWDELET